MNLKEIIEQNYKSIVKRGLITTDTTTTDFMDKLYEELIEVNDVLINQLINIDLPIKEELSFELADVILTALNFAKHYDIDIEHYLKEKIKINFER